MTSDDKSYKEVVYPMVEVKCALCRKVFIPARYHIYRRIFHDRTYLFCSWTCFDKSKYKKEGVLNENSNRKQCNKTDKGT